jgi:hypothetical protein
MEATRLADDGEPSGDLTIWDDIQFPFDPALRGAADLTLVDVNRAGEASGWEVDEEYSCDASGVVKVIIRNRSALYQREYTLGRWSPVAARASDAITVKPGLRHRYK